MVTYVLIEEIRCVVGYFGVYGSLASLRIPQKCFCFVTDPSEVFLPPYKPLKSVRARYLSFLILVECRGRSFNDNIV